MPNDRKPYRSESRILREIHLTLSKGAARLFRNNVGSAWQGKFFYRPDESIQIVRPQRVTYGLCEGSSDLIGWRSRIITEEDVGKRFAQFVAIEVKSPTGSVSKTQRAFVDAVKNAGGIAGIARSVPDAAEILTGDAADGN